MYKTKTGNPAQKSLPVQKKLNILIVDDDENSRESLKDIISGRGHNVTTLDEGMKCVNRCSENTFDIIFMDYHINELEGDMITELCGTDVTQMVRECFNVETTIYAYTGDNSMSAINDFKKNRMKGAFIKPVTPGLMNEFFTIIEKEMDDIPQLLKLSLKRKNFMYFGKKNKSQCVVNN